MITTVTDRTVLLDTSAAIALSNPQDKFHKSAINYYQNTKVIWIVLNVTTHETFTRQRYKRNLKQALKSYDYLRGTNFNLINFESSDESEARRILEKYNDQNFSFYDALCAAVMLRIGMYRVFAFDIHFWILGFQVEPGII